MWWSQACISTSSGLHTRCMSVPAYAAAVLTLFRWHTIACQQRAGHGTYWDLTDILECGWEGLLLELLHTSRCPGHCVCVLVVMFSLGECLMVQCKMLQSAGVPVYCQPVCSVDKMLPMVRHAWEAVHTVCRAYCCILGSCGAGHACCVSAVLTCGLTPGLLGAYTCVCCCSFDMRVVRVVRASRRGFVGLAS
jgi:hypothetical protein